MARARLKVYRARMGFADTVVAAPNRKAALAAWGARQDLFREGLAQELADDPKAVESALAHPGEVLQRPAGSTDGYRPGAAAPPDLPAAAKRSPAAKPRAKAAVPPRPAKAPPVVPRRPEPDRPALDAAEAELQRLDAEEAAALAELERRRSALDEEAASLGRRTAALRKAAQRSLERARAAFAAAGGR